MKSKKGFTLIELMVVMAIIAVLSVLMIAAIQAARNASIESQRRGNIKTLETALEAYASKNSNKYPTGTTVDTVPKLQTVLKGQGVLNQDISGLTLADGTADAAYLFSSHSADNYALVACKAGTSGSPTASYSASAWTIGGCGGTGETNVLVKVLR